MTIELGGRRAKAVLAPPDADGHALAAALGVEAPRGVVVLNGGTVDVPPEIEDRLRPMLQEGLAAVAAEERLTVLTGGTDAGIFSIFGEGLGRNASAPCIGIAPAGLVEAGLGTSQSDGGSGGDKVPLEPNHSHFVLVDADEWGGETRAMLALAAALGATAPSLAVLAGGGTVAEQEALGHARDGREILVLSGSGRLADRVARATSSADVRSDTLASEIASEGRIVVLALDRPPDELADLVRARLGEGA